MPLPYVVVGTDAPAVNGAKGRPRTQPVGIGATDISPIEPALVLDPDSVELARWLLHVEGAGVLVPVGSSAPAWLAPATVDGMAFIGGTWLDELASLMVGRTNVCMSSGNMTGSQPTVTAAEAEVTFGPDILVVDGDHLRDPDRRHGSSTMIAVGPGQELTVRRPGINDAGFDGDHTAYVAELRRRWRSSG